MNVYEKRNCDENTEVKSRLIFVKAKLRKKSTNRLLK